VFNFELLKLVQPFFIYLLREFRHGLRGYLSFAASEIAADEIAAKNWPPTQKADILNRRLAFRRF